MKIIKHGKPPGNQKHTVKCDNCKTKIELLTSEAERVSDPRDGDYYRYKCPVCPRDITWAVKPFYYY